MILTSIISPKIQIQKLVESCWAEIDAGKDKRKIIIGCICKHPTCNLEQFHSQLDNIIKTLNPNRHEIYIFGDINLDFLKYNHHSLLRCAFR